jgi:nitrile hydratase accessory protein
LSTLEAVREAASSPDDPAPFAEPWQAQAFALTVALHERGLFTWSEWAASLSAEVGGVDASADASDYYACWLRALERILAEKGMASRIEIDAVTHAWHAAARVTPHGRPIKLDY